MSLAEGTPAAHVGVIGGGTMGLGIAYVFAVSGSNVTVVEPSVMQQQSMWNSIDAAFSDAQGRGRLTEAEATDARGRIEAITAVDELPTGLDLIVESVPEDVALKRKVLLDAEARRPAILASNTSSISIDELAAGLSFPQQFLGMHFFNPVWSLRLVELIQGAATSEPTMVAVRGLVVSLSKESITVKDIAGFATSRLDMGAALEAMRMLEDGVATATDIDRAAVVAYRHPVGPLALSDIVGLDVRLDISRALEQSHGSRFAPPQILIDKVASGDLGKKTGRGFHDWTDTDLAP